MLCVSEDENEGIFMIPEKIAGNKNTNKTERIQQKKCNLQLG
jgi:hypothetical protein